MERAKKLLTTIEHLVASKTKRHIIGGILMSASIFLGGLAATVLSVKVDEYEQIYEEEK